MRDYGKKTGLPLMHLLGVRSYCDSGLYDVYSAEQVGPWETDWGPSISLEMWMEVSLNIISEIRSECACMRLSTKWLVFA